MPLFPNLATHFVSRTLQNRDFALDALRGLMIAGMILVNHPPPGVPVYGPLTHAEWHGWTLADTIFPGFLFVVGVSIRLAMANPQGRPLAPDATVYGKLLRRFILLWALNFLLVNFPYYFSGTIHFTGTLALIAWSYLVAALIYLHTTWRTQLTLVIITLLGQWAAFALIPVPGFGANVMTPDGNAARYLDRIAFPPGSLHGDGMDIVLLPTLGAITTTLIGVLAGHWLKSARALPDRIAGLFAVGLALIMVGNVWNELLPVNKPLWTASYLLLMAGIAMQLLAGIAWLTEHCGYRAWAVPLRIAGVNALFYYVFAQSLQRVLTYGRVTTQEGVIRLRYLAYERLFAPWISGERGALVFALVFSSICFAVVFVLYRKRLFIKL